MPPKKKNIQAIQVVQGLRNSNNPFQGLRLSVVLQDNLACTVEAPVATISRARPRLLSDQFSSFRLKSTHLESLVSDRLS